MKGIEAIKTSGGTTFAQDHSAQQSGMPISAVNTGCVDFVVSPRNIALEIGRLARVPELTFGSDPVQPAEDVDAILGIVRDRMRIDFSQYKENTLHRRIRRRMALSQKESLNGYAALLRDKPEETEALAQDILMGHQGIGANLLPRRCRGSWRPNHARRRPDRAGCLRNIGRCQQGVAVILGAPALDPGYFAQRRCANVFSRADRGSVPRCAPATR